MGVLLDGELALSDGVPDLDVLISATGGNLSVVRGESAGEDILGVRNESLGGGSLGDIPESEGAIPRGGEAISGVLGKGEILNEVRMSLEDLSGDSPFLLLVGVFSLDDIPDHDGLISGSGDKELSGGVLVDGLLTDVHAGDVATVSLHETSVFKFVLLCASASSKDERGLSFASISYQKLLTQSRSVFFYKCCR